MIDPRLPKNLRRDATTVAAMVRIACEARHGSAPGALCDACAALLAYADARLSHCPHGAAKTTCRECTIHCYRAGERESMRDVMRAAGPRMLLRHPILAIRHLWLDRRPAPDSRKGERVKR